MGFGCGGGSTCKAALKKFEESSGVEIIIILLYFVIFCYILLHFVIFYHNLINIQLYFFRRVRGQEQQSVLRLG